MARLNTQRGLLLGGQPLFRAHAADQLEAELRQKYNIRGAQFGDNDASFLGLANRVSVDGVTWHYCRYDMPTEIGFADMGGYRQIFCLAGAGEIGLSGRRMTLSPRVSGIVPPTSRFDAAYADRYQHLVVQFDEPLLRRHAERFTGRPLRDLDDMPVMTPLADAATERTRAIAICLAQQFAKPMERTSLAVAELANALVSGFLEERLAGLAPQCGRAAPPAARPIAARLRDHIHENWDQSLTVESIAAALGVSVRSVFAAFRQAFGIAPATYIRDLRLDHARRMLLEPGSTSVIDVAMACGFASFGHFARRYRDRFGELPSATLSRRPLLI